MVWKEPFFKRGSFQKAFHLKKIAKKRDKLALID